MDATSRRRLETMRRVQDVAVVLFQRRGFDGVSVEEIAREAGVGPASVYRHFGTKERLVLWDEYDPLLLEAVEGHLARGAAPFQALVDGVCDALGGFYTQERARLLDRTRLVVRTPALSAVARADLDRLRQDLTLALAKHVRSALTRELTAAVFTTLLDRAIDAWRRDGGRTPLTRFIRQGAKVVAALG